MIGYMMIPIGLTFEQQHIYILLYSKCDFNTMTVKYTVEQLITDSHKGFELTPMKVRNIIKFLTDNNYIEMVKRGTKGNPTIYKIIKIQQLNNNDLTIKQQLNNNYNGTTKPFIEGEQQLNNNCSTIKEQLNNNPIKEKEKEKEKDIYIENQSLSFTYMDLSFIDDCIVNVKITKEQYEKLKEKYPIKLIHDKIEALDNYKKIDDYKDHFRTLNIWCKKDKDKEEYKVQAPTKRRKKDPYAFLKDDYMIEE